MKRNPYFERLKNHYLFPEINRRKQEFLSKNPQAFLINLGIGDTTQPIPETASAKMQQTARLLATKEGYAGYGSDFGPYELRKKIASRIYQGRVSADDIFLSDGSKCDLGRLQMLFGHHPSIALQDPAYPVYLDGSLILGVNTVHTLPCRPENNFFPELKSVPQADLLYFCSPNNPTGAAATHEQLEELVAYAKASKSIIVFDSAYAHFIQDPHLPRSIFEIPGADEVAIETGSFSKIAGFTGVRLGWTVVPKALQYEEGGQVRSDWARLMSTVFNGASSLALAGGDAVLEEEGWQEINRLTRYYMDNAKLLRKAFEALGLQVYGGLHAPYLWAAYPGKSSWDVFQYLLETYGIVATPGSGFGPAGEGFMRFSAFADQAHILEAVNRLS